MHECTAVDWHDSDIKVNVVKLKDINGNIPSMVNLIKNMNNLTLLELHNISVNVLNPDEKQQLTDALSSLKSLVSLDLYAVHDTVLSDIFLSHLPQSTQQLNVRKIIPSHRYQLPLEVSLQHLYIENSLSGVEQLFTSRFPQLESLTIMSSFKWSEKDIRSLHSAVREERMPCLEEFCIRFGNLGKHGKYLLDIIRRPTVTAVDLMDTGLTMKDGQLLLGALRGGTLTNIELLNLLHNSGIHSIIPEILSECKEWSIDIYCSQTSPGKMLGCLSYITTTLYSAILEISKYLWESVVNILNRAMTNVKEF